MSAHPIALPRSVRETVSDLRSRLGLFSFQQEAVTSESTLRNGPGAVFRLRAGGIVEWLAATPGAGAVAYALQMISRPSSARGVMAIVDCAEECYAPALSGWGVSLGQILIIRPGTQKEAYWAIEQCLRCPGVCATWARVEHEIPTRVHRRWQLAAEGGGGVGLFFRPESARREPAWADLRVLVTPRAGGAGETRRVQINVLYHRGGLGGAARVWEIDHAEGAVRLVPEVADPTAEERAARA